MSEPQPATGKLKGNDELLVRFPVQDNHRVVKKRLPHLSDLLPRRWRRVVIQGQHYWLTG